MQETLAKRGFVLSIDAICGAGKSTLCRFIDQHFGSGSADVDNDERQRRLVSLLQDHHISERPLAWSKSDLLAPASSALPEPGTPGHAIAQMLIGGRVKVIVETPNKNLLEMFYAEPDRYAWLLQNITQKGCAEVHLNAHIEAERSDALILIDRSAIGNAAFAHLNHKINPNRITEKHLEHFDDFTKNHILNEFPSDMFVLLNMPLETCIKRLKQRSIKTGESIPDAAYLAQLEEQHDLFMAYEQGGAFPYAPQHASKKVVLETHAHVSVSELCSSLFAHLFVPRGPF